jgi:hypothetical protein
MRIRGAPNDFLVASDFHLLVSDVSQQQQNFPVKENEINKRLQMQHPSTEDEDNTGTRVGRHIYRSQAPHLQKQKNHRISNQL